MRNKHLKEETLAVVKQLIPLRVRINEFQFWDADHVYDHLLNDLEDLDCNEVYKIASKFLFEKQLRKVLR